LINLIDKDIKLTLEKRFGDRIERKPLFRNRISEAYHKAKADGSNPELVKAVEELIGQKVSSDVNIQQPMGESKVDDGAVGEIAKENEREEVKSKLPAKPKKLFATMGGQSFEVKDFQDASEKKAQLEKMPQEGRAYGKNAFVQLKDENNNDVGYIDWSGRIWKGTPNDLQTPENLLYAPKGKEKINYTESSDKSLPNGFQVYEFTNSTGKYYQVTERFGGAKSGAFKTKQEALNDFKKEYPNLVVTEQKTLSNEIKNPTPPAVNIEVPKPSIEVIEDDNKVEVKQTVENSQFTDVGYVAARKKADIILSDKKEATPVVGMRNAGNGSGVFVPFRIVKDEWINTETTKAESGETYIYDEVNDKYYNVKDFSKSEIDFLSDRDNFSEKETILETPKIEREQVKPKTAKEIAKEKLDEARANFRKAQGKMQSGGFGALPEFIDLVKAAIEYGFESSKEFLKEFRNDIDTKYSDSEVEAAFDSIVNPPSGEKPNLEQSSPKKRKKALLNRGYEGVTREDVKQAIKEMGLDYEVESRDIAKADAKAFIEKVGIKNAIKAVRTGKIVGARAAFVWAEAIDSIENMLSKARSESRKRNLSKALAELMDEFTTQSREGGRFISALADIYATSDFPYKLTNQIEKYKAINNGIIPKDIVEKFEQYEKELNELNEQIKASEERAKLAEEQAAVNNIKEDINRPKENNTYKQYAKKVADKIRRLKNKPPTFFDENGNEIKVFTAGFTWNDMVEYAAKAVEEAGNIADAVKEITEKLKEQEWYQKLSPKNKSIAEKELINAATPDSETDGKLKIKHSLIRELVEQGNNDIDSLTAAVKEAIKEEYPDATDREVRDAITGYGKTVNQNQEEIEKEIRQIKFVGKYLSALEDIAQKKRPLKSGAQRDKLTAEQRQKLKEIREAMKDLPIDLETQESQLKTALDAAKSRVRNRIEDLQREIDTKEQTKKNNKELVADEELKTLIEQRDALQYAHDLVFKGRPQTAGEKRINSLEKKLNDLLFKTVKGEGESAAFTAEEQKRIDDINEQIAKAKADLGLIKSKPLPKTEMEKVEAREQAKIDKLQTKLDELKQGIVSEKETKERTKESKEVADLREQIEREKQLLGLIEAAPTQAEKTELAIDAAIEETERKIRENDLAYEKANKVTTPEIEAKREILKASKEALNKLREETGLIEKRRLENAKKAAQRRIDELERRIREKDFSKKKSKPLIQDTELVNLNAKKLVVKGKFDKLQYENELRNRSDGEKIKDAIAEIWSLPRAVVATGEFSFVLIQGGIYTVSNPTLAWSAFKKAMQSFTSEKKANDYLNFIQAQEFYPRMKASKLALTEVDAKLTAREEQFLSGWVNHIWDMSLINWGLDKAKVNKDLRLKGNIYETWKALNPIKAIERAGVAFLNTMRVEKYLQGEEMLKMRGITFQSRPNDYKQMADVINTFTGRASLGKVLEPNAKGLSNILFSPRNWASLLKQVLLPLYLVNKGSKGEGEGTMSLLRQGKIKPSVAQKMAMTDFLKAVGITTSFVMLVAYALNNDDDDETEVSFDMTSSDFMKVRLGNLRLDPWGGKIQQVVFLNRLFADLYNYEGNFLNIAFKTLKNKLSPSTRLAVNYAEKKINAQGYLTDPYGNEYSLQNEITGDAYPMYLGTLSELNKDQPALIATSAGALAFFGFGMQVYESKENFKKPVKDYFKEINYKPSIDKRMDEDFIDLQGQPISEDDYAKFVINVNQKFNDFLDANLEKVKNMKINVVSTKLTDEQKEEKKQNIRKKTIASAQNSIEKMEVLTIKLSNKKITKDEYDKEMKKVTDKIKKVMKDIDKGVKYTPEK